MRTKAGNARELRHELAPTLANQFGQLRLMIGEIQKRVRGREFLAHEQHRRLRPEQQQRGQCPVPARRGQRVRAQAARRVGDLVVVLQEVDEVRGGDISRRRCPRCLPCRAFHWPWYR